MNLPRSFAPRTDDEAFHAAAAPAVAQLSGYAAPSAAKGLWQLGTTVVPYAAVWLLMYKSLAVSYGLTLLLSIPAALFLVRLFIFQHDAGHGSFFPAKWANDLTGALIGVLTLTPYRYWQKTHAIHHATSGNLDKRGFGDIDTLTLREYENLDPAAQRRYRLYRHPVTMFLAGPFLQFLLKHRFPYNIPFAWRREWASVLYTNAALAAIAALAWSTIGLKELLMVQAPIVFFSASAGAWLFYVQHQYEDTYWEREDRWDYFEAAVKGSSYYVLPKILQWFTGHIGLHHIHHYNSRIPNYLLQKCYDENPAFQNVTRLDLRKSLRSIRLSLWDEETKKLVPFPHGEAPGGGARTA